jgi:hypothetical protein
VKSAAIALFCLAIALPSFAQDERTAKRALIAEVLDIIDAKALTQASFDIAFNKVMEAGAAEGEQSEEYKEEIEQMKVFRERLYNRIDYAKYAEEIYAPLFDEHYTADELRQLIAFYKTKAGQKSVRMLPELAIGGLMKGMTLLEQAARETAEELQKEETQKHPWKSTMADMRTLAVALEARATDVESYPETDLSGLKPLLEPTYVQTLPEKDAWGTPFLYIGNGRQYRIVSAGADKRFEWNARQFESAAGEARVTEDPDADIIFQDGAFVQHPKKAGQQQ